MKAPKASSAAVLVQGLHIHVPLFGDGGCSHDLRKQPFGFVVPVQQAVLAALGIGSSKYIKSIHALSTR